MSRSPIIGVEFTGVTAEIITVSGVTIGLSPEQVRDLTEAASKGAVGPLVERIVDLSRTLGATQEAVLNMLRILGHTDVSLEQLPEKLVEIAAQSKRATSAIGALQLECPFPSQNIAKASAAATLQRLGFS